MRFNRHVIPQGLAVVLLAAGLSMGGDAHAAFSGADDKGVTGAQCVGSGGNPWGHYAIRPSGIQNVYSGLRYISCTLTTDSEGTWSSYTGGEGDLYLTFNYSQGGGTTTCTVQLTDNSGAVVTYTDSVTSAATSVRQSISFAAMAEGRAEGRPISFNCLLPSKVILTNINWEEYAETDNSPTL